MYSHPRVNSLFQYIALVLFFTIQSLDRSVCFQAINNGLAAALVCDLPAAR